MTTAQETADLRALPSVELQSELDESLRALFNLRFQAATRQLADVSQVRRARRRVARVRTLLRERDILAAIAEPGDADALAGNEAMDEAPDDDAVADETTDEAAADDAAADETTDEAAADDAADEAPADETTDDAAGDDAAADETTDEAAGDDAAADETTDEAADDDAADGERE